MERLTQTVCIRTKIFVQLLPRILTHRPNPGSRTAWHKRHLPVILSWLTSQKLRGLFSRYADKTYSARKAFIEKISNNNISTYSFYDELCNVNSSSVSRKHGAPIFACGQFVNNLD